MKLYNKYISGTLLATFLLCGFFCRAQQRIEHTVYFGFNRSQLSQENKKTLDSISLAIGDMPAYSIIIKGYTDDAGTKEYNLVLADSRARSVYTYLLDKGIDSARIVFNGNGEDITAQQIPAFAKRKAVIEIELQERKDHSFYGKYGTEVIAQDNDPLNITEYFTTAAMLRDSMYAQDENDDILETGGMITICRQNGELDKSGKFYIVKVPGQKTYLDTAMQIWIQSENRSGATRWKLTTIKVTYDHVNRLYIFKVPVGAKNCININLDKRIGLPERVYVSTYKPFNFYDIVIQNGRDELSFSAKLSDTLYVFTKAQDVEVRNMKFNGYMKMNSHDSIIKIWLGDCIHSSYRGSDHYYICEKCLAPKTSVLSEPEVQPEKKQVEKQPKRRRGFFQWLADLFRKK